MFKTIVAVLVALAFSATSSMAWYSKPTKSTSSKSYAKKSYAKKASSKSYAKK